MKKYLYITLGIIFGLAGTVYGATVFNSNQVGSSPQNGYILQTDGTVSTWVANSGGSGNSFAFPFTVKAGYNSTSTTIGFTNGLFSTASSTFNGPFYFPNIVSKTLNVDSNGLVYGSGTSTPGTTAPIGYSGTLGQFIGGVSGNFTCTNASSGVTGCLTGTDWNTFNGKSGFAFPFTVNTGYNSTSTVLGLNGLFSTASTTFSGPLHLPLITSSFLGTDSFGNVFGFATSTIKTSQLNNDAGWTNNTGTVTSVGLSDSNSTLTIGSTPITTNGTITATLNLGHANTWTGLQQFNGQASSTIFSANYLSVGGISTTTISDTGVVTLATTTKGCLAIGSTGIIYASNSAATVSCGTLTGIGLSDSNSTLTIGNTPITIGAGTITATLNLAHTNQWSVLQQFYGNASTTGLSANYLSVGQTATTSITNAGAVNIATSTSYNNSILNVNGTTTVSGQFASITASTSASATQNINWASGNTQAIMLTANTSIVMNATSSNPIDGGKYVLKICQDPTGSRTLTWANPIPLRWETDNGGNNLGTTTITSTANKCTWIGMFYTSQNGNSIYQVMASTTNRSLN